MHVVEALLGEVYATKNVHRPIRAARRMPVAPFYLPLYLLRLEPDALD